ncbi:MAG: DUF2029 domain-containing protein [Alphaproteobacteria bacterium]|nr:DUF2029 domain-containing protein [Alphaproteobacteria bacterium]
MREMLRSGVWLTDKRRRAWCLIALVGFISALVFLIVTSSDGMDFKGRPLGTDFLNVWAAGRLALEGTPALAWDYPSHARVEIALFPKLATYYGWHYPPPLLIVAALLALLPYLASVAVWLAVTFEMMRQAARGLVFDRLAAWAFPGLFINITHGHNAFLSSALLLGGLRLLDSHPWLAGALLGGLSFKPQLGVLIPVALAAGGLWRAFGGATLSVLGMAVLSWLVLGMESWQAFIDSVPLTRHAVLEGGAIGYGKMQNVFAAARLLGAGIDLAWMIQAVSALVAAGVVAWLWRRSETMLEDKAASLVLGTLLAAPYLLDYDLMLLAVPLLLKAHGGKFRPWEISFYALLWALPLLARPFGMWLFVPLTPLVAMLGLWLLVHQAKASSP